ncbi:hypothetical protein [Planobispora rosea]|uniref:hypothetical protein n=1 Tax=Planobispora rosea TaxID=35762 RepID=UPI000839FE4E|nr:hypothetical protein [Planobispora rosea]
MEPAQPDGPAGPALAYRLTGSDRDGVLRELLALAARDRLPAADLGEQLAARVRWEGLVIGDVTSPLEQAAHRGAYRDVWTVVAAMLPRLLPDPGRQALRGLPGLVELGVAAAGWAGARGETPEVAAVAARPGPGSLTRRCRRLHTLLTRS